MVSGNSKTVLLASVGPAALLALVLLAQWRSTACPFWEQPSGSGLFTCNQRGGSLAALVRVSRPQGWLWTKRQVDHWTLVDAGSARNSWLWGRYASGMVGAVRRTLRPTRGRQQGQLDLIILTGSRATGALPELLKAYPEALVAAHEDEAPYLVGDPRPAPTNMTQLPRGASIGGVPQDRFLPLPGEEGDVSDAALAAGGRAKKALQWLPHGTLRYFRSSNPHPGSIAVVHIPSGGMLAGEALAPTKGWLGAWRGLTVSPQATAEQRAAAKRVVAAEGYAWLLPAAGGNFSRQVVEEQAGRWPERSAKEEKEARQQEREKKKMEKRRLREELKEARRVEKEERKRVRAEKKERKKQDRAQAKEAAVQEKKGKKEERVHANEAGVQENKVVDAQPAAAAAVHTAGGIMEAAKRAAEDVAGRTGGLLEAAKRGAEDVAGHTGGALSEAARRAAEAAKRAAEDVAGRTGGLLEAAKRTAEDVAGQTGALVQAAKRAAEGAADTAAAGLGLSLSKPEPGRGVKGEEAPSAAEL